MGAIVTSAGQVGVQRRSYERLYVTGREPVTEVCAVIDTLSRLEGIVTQRSRVPRAVFRLITNQTTLETLAAEGLRSEVAAPLDHVDEAGSVFAMFAVANAKRSEPLVKRADIIRQTTPETLAKTATAPEVDLNAWGYQLCSQLETSQFDSLQELWGPTFDWSDENISVLQRRLNDAVNSGLWFAGVYHQSDSTQLVSAAMAEMVTLRGISRDIPFVENSEWRTLRRHPDQVSGLIVPVIRQLNHAIVNEVDRPFIFAECNYTTRADRRGHQAGMVIPNRTYADQILVQNVAVHDGADSHLLRDFIFMTLAENGRS
ncbi:hypothetical protein IPO96_00935 [Candidatus Saccharibacteria bacterium]|nr:MAG: hypothetical protein IPO96_00935 [Candidatus Saccharibacteria bacterium]